MWNDSYRDYVKQVILSNKNTYPYYVAHTVTYIDSYSGNNRASFKIYLSSEPFTTNDGYNFVSTGDTVVYSVIGNNANSNYHNKRVSVADHTGNVTVDEYEFVYTNSETTGVCVQPDLLASSQLSQTHFDGVGLILITILLATVVFKLIRK